MTRHAVDNARRFVAEYGKDLRYCVEWKKWLAWDGVRWRLDPTGAAPARYAIALSDTIAEEAVGKEQKLWALKTRESYRRNMMVQDASHSSSIAIVQDDLDKDPMILVTQKGTIDLRTGILRENLREDLATRMAGTHMDPDVPIPNWLQFLNQVTRGDIPLQKYLQRVIGYMLTADVSEQVMFFFFGIGSNGKGTFLKTLMKMLGDYAQPAARGLLEQSNSSDHPTHIASLRKARVAVCSEVEQGRELAEALVKDLTGDDKLSARRMREDMWHFEPTHKVILQGQHKPIIKGDDDGIWRRVQSMPWLARFKGEDAVVAMDDATVVEKRIYSYFTKYLNDELPGILAWSVEGCLEWQRIRLSPPPIVVNSIAEYKAEMFNVPAWMKERVEHAPGSYVSRAELREDYLAWTVEKNFPPCDERKFVQQMRGHINKAAGLNEAVTDFPSEINHRVSDGPKWPVRAWKHLKLRDFEARPAKPELQ